MHVEPSEEESWTVVVDTAEPTGVPEETRSFAGGDTLEINARSTVVLQRPITTEVKL